MPLPPAQQVRGWKCLGASLLLLVRSISSTTSQNHQSIFRSTWAPCLSYASTLVSVILFNNMADIRSIKHHIGAHHMLYICTSPHSHMIEANANATSPDRRKLQKTKFQAALSVVVSTFACVEQPGNRIWAVMQVYVRHLRANYIKDS